MSLLVFDIALYTSIDFFSFSIQDCSWIQLADILEKEGFYIAKLRSKNKKYRKLQKFVSEKWGVSIECLHETKAYRPPAYFTVHKPSKEFVAWLDSIINAIGCTTKLSEMELAFDFFSDFNDSLKLFLWEHIFLLYSYKMPFIYGESLYTTNIRNSRKGNRIYIKEIYGKPAVRLELKLDREIIKKLQYDISLKNINDIDISRYFDFRKLNLSKLRKRFRRIQRTKVGRSSRTRYRWEGLIDAHLNSILSCYPSDEKMTILNKKNNRFKRDWMRWIYSKSIMNKKSIVKDFIPKNYGYYILKCREFQSWFDREVERQGFLKSFDELKAPRLKYFNIQFLDDEDVVISAING